VCKSQPRCTRVRAENLDAWIFEGTGIQQGDRFPGIVGYEYDHAAVPDQRPDTLTVVASSPVNVLRGADTSVSGIYTAESGATVFAAGTIAWCWGLDNYGHEK